MSAIRRIAQMAASVETSARAGDFLHTARLVLATRGALHTAAGNPMPSRVGTIVSKAAAGAGSLSDPSWASALAEYRQAVEAFSTTLAQAAVFDALLLGGMRRAPLRSRGVLVQTGASGGEVDENAVKPLSQLTLGSTTLEPRKVISMLVFSEELARFSRPSAIELFNTELRTAIAAATDAVFLAELIASVTPTASAGSTLANILADLGVLLTAVTSGPTSRLFYVIGSANAKALTVKASATGAPAFPSMGPNGGEILPGVTALVSDAIPSGHALMIAADGIVGDADIITLDTARHANLQFDSSPDSPPTASTTLVSLWSRNLLALRAERYFGFTIARTGAVAALSGVNYTS